MQINMLKSKIHRATVVQSELDYVGSITIDEELMEAAEKLAKTIMSKAPIAIKMAKVAINNGINTDLKIGVQFEAESYTSTFVSEDRVEGMKAFVEKRPAEFKNK